MKTNVIQEKKKDAELKVEVIRAKKGIPTIIEYNGYRYILQHLDQYRAKIKNGVISWLNFTW